jgi:hypothetical protein
MRKVFCNDDLRSAEISRQYDRENKESRKPMSILPDVAGNAALSICESLLLALNDRNILPEKEIIGVLRDAAAAHSNAPEGSGNEAMHEAVSALINQIIDGGNSVRRL